MLINRKIELQEKTISISINLWNVILKYVSRHKNYVDGSPLSKSAIYDSIHAYTSSIALDANIPTPLRLKSHRPHSILNE